MLLTLLLLFVPSLLLALLITLVIHGNAYMLGIIFSIGMSIVITGNDTLGEEYLILPILIFAIAIYSMFFTGGGNNE